MQHRIPYSSCDHTLISNVKELFDKLFTRRLLIRLIGVRFSHLAQGGHQVNLFEDSQEIIQLYQAMDKIRKKFGGDKIHRAAGEAFKLREFNPFNGVRKTV
jgi:DNA polymerase-4